MPTCFTWRTCCRSSPAPVVHGDADEKIVGVGLGILDADVEVAAIVEDAGIGELELGLGAPASAVFLHEPSVGILRLRVLVEEGGRVGIAVEDAERVTVNEVGRSGREADHPRVEVFDDLEEPLENRAVCLIEDDEVEEGRTESVIA